MDKNECTEFQRICLDLLDATTQIGTQKLLALMEVPQSMDKGDLALPCFQLAKELKQNPAEIAEHIAKEAKSRAKKINFIYDIVAEGPYVNFFAKNAVLAKQVLESVSEEREKFGHQSQEQPKTCVLEYSSPNIAKPFSVGHIRTTNIGACLSRIFEARGWNVIRINHLGDWGTQFGKVMLAYRMWGRAEDLNEDPIGTLYELYVRFHQEEEKKPELTDEARAWFAKLEQGDPEATELWQWFKDLSIKELQSLYEELGVDFDHYWGESFYMEFLPKVFQALQQHELLETSDEAKIVNLKDHDLGVSVVQKKDESSLYISRDLAAAIYRQEQFDFDAMIYVVGAPQRLHFQQLFKILELMGKSWVEKCEHVSFGHLSLGSEGMSTRKGNVVFLRDVLDKAADMALQVVKEKNPDLKDASEVARKVALAAVLFADVSVRRMKDVKFSWEDILSFEGDTGPYLQYSLVRTKSLLRKIGSVEETGDIEYGLLASRDEAALIRLLESFGQVIAKAEREREPFVIGEYALKLAQEFNRFYAHHRVLDAEAQLARVRTKLVKAVSQTLQNALELLGIPILEEM